MEGIKLLLFADYSQEVFKKRKTFSQLCASLHHKRVKFNLSYPAILHVQTPQGERVSFASLAETERYVSTKQGKLPQAQSPDG